jgi:anaerobic ribonucleoside-triphosphate reductase activating protein
LTSDIDILCYTGFSFSTIQEKHGEILKLLDAVVSEPFEAGMPTEKYLCGSENQLLRPLSEVGALRYAAAKIALPPVKQMDVCLSENSVWFAGIPRKGDLRKLVCALKKRGIHLGAFSWRA